MGEQTAYDCPEQKRKSNYLIHVGLYCNCIITICFPWTGQRGPAIHNSSSHSWVHLIQLHNRIPHAPEVHPCLVEMSGGNVWWICRTLPLWVRHQLSRHIMVDINWHANIHQLSRHIMVDIHWQTRIYTSWWFSYWAELSCGQTSYLIGRCFWEVMRSHHGYVGNTWGQLI